ncbi:MAG: phosphatase PAP2 family protein [Chlamydiota bacterium]
MDQSPPAQTWNIKVLLLPPLMTALLFLSWKLPLIKPFWDHFDRFIFDLLNPWIHTNWFWQNFWAFNGSWVMDWVHDIAMLLFFLIPLYQAPKREKKRKLAELIFSIFLLLFIIAIVNGTLFPEFLHTKRLSPTVIDPTAFRLSTAVNWIAVKDHSYASFPGDHGTFVMAFTCLIFYLIGKKAGTIAILYSIFFCLPRLITGAHWFTDIFLGSLPIAIIMTSISFGTPFAYLLITGLEKGLAKLYTRADSK